MVTKTYDEAVTALVDRLYDNSDLEHLKEIVEDGKLGVRQMTNSQLQNEWTLQFSEALTLTDPDTNPNDTLSGGRAKDHSLPTPALPAASASLRLPHRFQETESYIDPALHEFIVLTLFDVHPCLEQVHSAKPAGVDWDLVKAALDEVRNAVEATEDTVRRLSAWQKAGANPGELAAIAWAGGYDAILQDSDAQTRFQDMLDRCVHSRLLEMREAFCSAGWSGAPSPLAPKASGPVYEPLRKEDAGRTLVLAHRLTPNSGASDKVVAVTFEIFDITTSESDKWGTPVISVRDRFTDPATETVQEILYRLDTADLAAALLARPDKRPSGESPRRRQESAPRASEPSVDTPAESEKQPQERTFRISYRHDDCPVEPGVKWEDTWSCACNGVCPACDQKDIEPVDWEDVSDGPGVYEVELPGFDGGTDETDHLIKWVRADSRVDVCERYPGSTVSMLEFVPPETDIDDTIERNAHSRNELVDSGPSMM